ncbi:Hypothetical predicted protein [Pelobates cultripes]|uniref:Uncharacterized protein n=1 Tax=Pelobates cultripes TaxID=61616 RepID=A0AAD1SES2_PELCU|nr:Hypothetical predicted protein [Pelobates cultripes]
MPPKPRAGTPRAPSTLKAVIPWLKDPPQQLPSRPKIHRIEPPLQDPDNRPQCDLLATGIG